MPVGQGGFHVGALSLVDENHLTALDFEGVARFADADFVYVYDCGSIPRKQVTAHVRALRVARPTSDLDMLFLSHFDLDHMCGTPDLLHPLHGFRVRTIVLPFVDDVERIVAFSRAAAAQAETGRKISHFFADMVVDPIGTLGEFGPDQIILVVGPEDGRDGPSEGSPAEPPRPMREDRVAWKIVPSDENDPQGFEITRLPGAQQAMMMRGAAISIHDWTWTLEWRLHPWVKPADPAALARFQSEAETQLGWPPGSFPVRMADKAERRRVVTKRRMALAKAYKLAFADKNLTSLCLYSGPMRPEDGHSLTLVPDLPDNPVTKIGWLGTGDAHLALADGIASFERAYRSEMSFVSTFMFPHHGSIENTDPAHLISDADIWVAAADPVHEWEHPHWKLRQAVASRGASFRHVRARESTALDEAMLFWRQQDMTP